MTHHIFGKPYKLENQDDRERICDLIKENSTTESLDGLASIAYSLLGAVTTLNDKMNPKPINGHES